MELDRKRSLVTRRVCLIAGMLLTSMHTAAMSEKHVGQVLFSVNEGGSGNAIPFRIHLRATQMGMPAELLERYISIFEEADTDADRRIVLNDLQTHEKEVGKDMFATLDQDRDNVLLREELPDSQQDSIWFRTLDRKFSFPVTLDAAQQPKRPLWHDQFSCPGPTSFSLPEGEYEYVVARGPEYTTAQGTFEVSADDVLEFAPTLERIADLTSEGWWSGDLHVHRPVEEMKLIMLAEDLHVAPCITWWNNRIGWTEVTLPVNPVRNFGDNRFCDVLAGEDERRGGAYLYFNMKRPLDIAGAEKEYPSLLAFIEEAKAESPNVWVDIEKPFWWDVPVALAHGYGDSIGLAHNHMWMEGEYEDEAWGRPRGSDYDMQFGNAVYTQDLYYHILNSGIRIPPSAGSASGVMMSPVGYNRVYVNVEAPFTYTKWWEALREGRCFVTNGPLLRTRANGQLPGHVFINETDADLEIEVTARLDGSDTVPAIEIIKNGIVERTVPYDEFAETGSLGSLRFERSGWFLVRAIADNNTAFRFASTAPYYVEIGTERHHISRRSTAFFRKWIDDRIDQIERTELENPEEVLKYQYKARTFWEKRFANANAE